jgi:hypothetical protein
MAAQHAQSSNYILAGLNCADNIHLVIGTNPLAAARCTQSLGAGAHPILIAPETAELHYSLQSKIDDGSVKWVRTAFENEHLFQLGREEVGRVVDAVFVTSGLREELGAYIIIIIIMALHLHIASTPLTQNITRLTHLLSLQAQSHPRQRRRRPPSLHLLPPIHSLRRPSPDRRHHQRPRLQTRLSHPS